MKNILLTSFLTICTFGAFAQLTVKPSGPSGANPTYIYVKNQYIYVKQNVNLQINPGLEDSETKASIFLREGAQLVQGDGANQLNSGNGYLSVYQTVIGQDSFDYTYWCPPVGYGPDGLTLPATGNLNFGALQFYQPIPNPTLPSLTKSRKAEVISGFGNNGNIDPMQINRRWLHTNPVDAGFVRFNASYGVTPGLGFTMKGLGIGNHDQLYDFRGRPNNGTITVGVDPTNVTLSGNPYPSALDLDQMFYDTENLAIESFEYWDEDKTSGDHTYVQNKGGYGKWVPTGPGYDATGTKPGVYTRALFLNYNGDGTAGTSTNVFGANYQRRFAPIGQGFMIRARNPGTVKIKNIFRKPVQEGFANLSQFHRGINSVPDQLSDADISGDNDVYVPEPSIRIYTSFHESFTRDMVLVFSENATDGFDRGYDASHPMDASSEVYVPIELEDGMKEFVISGNNYDYNKEYPVNFEINNMSKINLRIVEKENMPVEKVYLWDNLNDTYYRIDNNNKAEFALPVGNYNGRFFIVFNPDRRLEDKNGYNETFAKVQANVDFFQDNKVGQLEVYNPEAFVIKSAGIYDMSGKLVYTQNNLGNSTNFSFPTANLSDGVYLVKLLTNDNIAIDYKTIVQNK